MRMIAITLLLFTLGWLPNTMVQAEDYPLVEDVATPEAITLALHRWASTQVGETLDHALLKSLIVREAYMVRIRQTDGKSHSKMFSLTERFVTPEAKPETIGWLETVTDMKVSHEGNGANVWASYEVRQTVGGPVVKKGVTNTQLFYDGVRWWILGFVDIPTMEQTP